MLGAVFHDTYNTNLLYHRVWYCASKMGFLNTMNENLECIYLIYNDMDNLLGSANFILLTNVIAFKRNSSV